MLNRPPPALVRKQNSAGLLGLLALSTQWLRFQQRRLSRYQPKVQVSWESGRYLVKTITHWQELEELLRLRHEIFHRECLDRGLPFGLDLDEMDFICDHLVIRDREQDRLIGSYRLTCSSFSRQFYANSRFDLDAFINTPGYKLELGRACVDRSYRNGVTLNLLWRGIGEYLRATGSAHLFGSASIRNQDPHAIARIWHSLTREGYTTQDIPVWARDSAEVPGFAQALRETAYEELRPVSELVPPLFLSYLRGGAKIACLPTQDPHMGSTDFLAVLSTQGASRLIARYT